MSVVYIISSRIEPGIYKIGQHTGDLKGLKCRYCTYLHKNLIVHWFIETENAKLLESQVLNKFNRLRVKKSNNAPTEWIKVPLENILETIFPMIPGKYNLKCDGETIILINNPVYACDETSDDIENETSDDIENESNDIINEKLNSLKKSRFNTVLTPAKENISEDTTDTTEI